MNKKWFVVAAIGVFIFGIGGLVGIIITAPKIAQLTEANDLYGNFYDKWYGCSRGDFVGCAHNLDYDVNTVSWEDGKGAYLISKDFTGFIETYCGWWTEDSTILNPIFSDVNVINLVFDTNAYSDVNWTWVEVDLNEDTLFNEIPNFEECEEVSCGCHEWGCLMACYLCPEKQDDTKQEGK